MAQRRQLQRAPIAEALVDLRTQAHAALGEASTRDRLTRQLLPKYTKREEMRAFEAKVSFAPGSPPVPEGAFRGFHGDVFRSDDGKDVAQFRVDGFTYNRLRPYTDGDARLNEALRLWPLYLEAAAPRDVKRIALRYINRLEGLRPDEFQEILTDPPKSSPGAPTAMESFLTRVVNVDNRSGLSVITTLNHERAVAGGTYVLVLDIDAFLLGDFETSTETIEAALAGLRELKNAVFFGTLTESGVARYE